MARLAVGFACGAAFGAASSVALAHLVRQQKKQQRQETKEDADDMGESDQQGWSTRGTIGSEGSESRADNQLEQPPSACPREPREIPDSLRKELFSRNEFFFGEEGFAKIRNGFVVVVGLGGVGSHAAHMLVRSGVKRLRVIDFDQVSLSSLNRHAVATWEDVGRPKATVLRERLLAIVPDAIIDPQCFLLNQENVAELLAGSPAFVLDCIDDVPTKAALLAHCVQQSIPVVSSLGAGCRSDPTRLCISSLEDCTRDKLAAKLRHIFRKNYAGLNPKHIRCLFSSEKAVSDLTELSEEQSKDPESFGAMEHFRLRVVPVLGTIPAIFGQALATWTLCELGDKPFTPNLTEKLSKALRQRLQQRLLRRERELFDVHNKLNLEEIDYIVTQTWRSRCAIYGSHIKQGTMNGRLARWEASEPCTPENVVLLSEKALNAFDKHGQEAFTEEQREAVNLALLRGM